WPPPPICSGWWWSMAARCGQTRRWCSSHSSISHRATPRRRCRRRSGCGATTLIRRSSHAPSSGGPGPTLISRTTRTAALCFRRRWAAGQAPAQGTHRRTAFRGGGAVTPRVEADTPLMQQYREIKARYPQTILFFRMGDFYEMFEDDARLAARELGLTLTSRNNGGAADVPLAGVPVKAGTEYLRRLIAKGHRVAICEQVEDPKLAKGLVRREVVETVTPGTASGGATERPSAPQGRCSDTPGS